ncbi:MAG TPA: DUF1707 domain-containing protein [Candidatus Dormibacteraeota bacterium]|jgi:hypothetical protein|nr:DUF1707 domain-containing protein [Candidatus Dormibacteraeota bacterium]
MGDDEALVPPPPEPPTNPGGLGPSIRASDAERDQTLVVLREAAAEGRLTLDELSTRVETALSARTRADLDQVTIDLPVSTSAAPATPAVPRTPGGPMAVARRAKRWSIAILGGVERKGTWRIEEEHWTVCLMGGAKLDLRNAIITSPVTTINVVAVMGGCEIVVPEGVHVDLGGIDIMGGKDVKLAGPPPPPEAPVVQINSYCLMGGLSITDQAGPSAMDMPSEWMQQHAQRQQLRMQQHAQRQQLRMQRRMERHLRHRDP